MKLTRPRVGKGPLSEPLDRRTPPPTVDHAAGSPGLPDLWTFLTSLTRRPILLADADHPLMPVVAASEAVSGDGDRRLGEPLEGWLGADSSGDIRRAVGAGAPRGRAPGWTWSVAEADGRRWLVCERTTAAWPSSSPVVADDQTSDDGAADRRRRVLIAAYEAALAIATEVSLEAVLQRLVDLARTVVPARYAALGVADEQGQITQFVTSGISPSERAAIGDLPKGRGLLGVLIRERTPLRIAEMGADPRSAGFPPNHPPMRSLLGMPILLGDRALGNIYLTERVDGLPFTEEDEAALKALAAHAASAIERAKLFNELERTSERAAEQRDQLRVILNNLPTGVLIQAGPDAQIELANTAAIQMLLGTAAPTGALPTYGRDYRLRYADGTPFPADQRPGLRAMRGEAVRNLQLTLDRWDGRQLPVLVQASPLRGAAGEARRAVVVFQDITRLREAEQLKDDFLSLVSHEFRTPLTAIHGGAYLLANQGADLDDETRAELLDDIVTESGRLDRMLSNMLSLAAIQAGRLQATTEPVLLEPLARKVSAQVAARSPAHRFAVDIPADLPPAEGDPELLEQVLRNLYENAVKYSPDGGEVRTTAGAAADAVTLHVSDQGIGIARDQVAHVFERFHRAGTDPTIRGMGLGLYLSRLLVEAQEGRIAASSAGPGQGATFSVTLPLARGWP